MTLELAEECIHQVKLKARELGISLSIAVVDEAGKLVAYARMDAGSGTFGEKKELAKARTAVVYKRSTKEVMDNFKNREGNYYIVGMSAMYPDEFWAGPGGAVIIVDGEIAGGVGVSGSTAENDHRCASAAVESLRARP